MKYPEMRKMHRQGGDLPLKPFRFGAFEGNRRVKSFGFRHDHTLQKLTESDPIPDWLQAVARAVERPRTRPPSEFQLK